MNSATGAMKNKQAGAVYTSAWVRVPWGRGRVGVGKCVGVGTVR